MGSLGRAPQTSGKGLAADFGTSFQMRNIKTLLPRLTEGFLYYIYNGTLCHSGCSILVVFLIHEDILLVRIDVTLA